MVVVGGMDTGRKPGGGGMSEELLWLSMETPSYGSVGWKPLVWVCHVLYYFPIETRETSHRSPEVKKGYRIDIVKWMCATRDWVNVRT